MRSTTALSALAALVIAAPAALAQLATLRGTIPGSLHQCEDTTVFFFDSGNASPKTLILLPQGTGPSGTTDLSTVQNLGPLQVIDGITTPDAQSYGFTLAIAAGVSFDTYGFLPDGTGKNLDLPRTVQTPLPGASQCNPASVGAVAAAQTQASSSSSTAPSMTTSVVAQATSSSVAALSSSSSSSMSMSKASVASSASRSASSAASAGASGSQSGSAAQASKSSSSGSTSGAGAGQAIGVGAAFIAFGAAVVAAL
ncbi:hypothetical protein BMF94_2045 [Rhodotorula taiwanensis]|uniref:Uncharacterized protein n=1 Tax=Rhodotorula taiwanensis TaxID=741276 RepID=A0A2S5BE76_9BASI|nr:hypothetical protein BMF94_2045 [Rhodotorula taiwanensis]